MAAVKKAAKAKKTSAPKKGKTSPAKKAAASAPKKHTPAKKAPAKKTAPAKATKSKRSLGKASGGQSLPRDMNEHGFVKGSDSATIVDLMLEGAESRNALQDKIKKTLGRSTTRNGAPFNVSSTVSSLVKRLEEKGYVVQESWILMPPTPQSKAAATRRAKKAGAAEKPQKPAGKAAKKATASKPARKTAKRAKRS